MEERYPNPGQILDSLREVELLVAELYRRFGEAFPRDREIWDALRRDEEGHAAMAGEMKGVLIANAASFALGRTNLATLGTYRKGLEYHLTRLQSGALTRQNALFIARDLEKTLVEKAFYELIKSDNPEYLALQARIRDETGSHLQSLEKYIREMSDRLN